MPDDVITFGPDRAPRRDAGESIEALFHAHYARVANTAFSLVGDWHLAEQLAQEAYLRLWRRWRWISDPQAAPIYLQRTVVNLSRATIRRKVIERRAVDARRMERPPAAAPDAADLIELRRAIGGLPARKRECVVLRYLLGLSEAETASLLGVSVGTVKSQTHKGLRQLRDRLDTIAAGTGSAAGPGKAAAAGSAARSGKAAGSGKPARPGNAAGRGKAAGPERTAT